MATKREIIAGALSEIGLGLYIFDSTPEQLEDARKRLDLIAARISATGPRWGYSMGTGLDTETGLPDTVQEYFRLALAISIAPTYGKAVSRETTAQFMQAKNAMLITNYTIPQVQYPTTMPIGTGNQIGVKDRPYFQPPDDLLAGNDGVIDLSQ